MSNNEDLLDIPTEEGYVPRQIIDLFFYRVLEYTR